MRLAPNASSYLFWRSFSHSILLIFFYIFIFGLQALAAFARHGAHISSGFVIVSLIFGIILFIDFMVCYFYASALANSYFYDITPEGIALQKGVFNQTHEKMPYAKVQDVFVQSTILSRMFGLASVTIQNATGGMVYRAYGNNGLGNSGAMVIPALDIATADTLRDDILKHVNQTHAHPL